MFWAVTVTVTELGLVAAVPRLIKKFWRGVKFIPEIVPDTPEVEQVIGVLLVVPFPTTAITVPTSVLQYMVETVVEAAGFHIIHVPEAVANILEALSMVDEAIKMLLS